MNTKNPRKAPRGMVTVELAIGLLALTLITVFLSWVIHLGVVQAQCYDTATQIARHTARGDTAEAKRSIEQAPKGSKVEAKRVAGDIVATVRFDATFFGIGVIKLEGAAKYPLEPGVQ